MNTYDLAECRGVMHRYGLDPWGLAPHPWGYQLLDEYATLQGFLLHRRDGAWLGCYREPWVNSKLRPTAPKALDAILQVMSCYRIIAKPKEAQQ